MAYTTIDKPSDYFNTVIYTGNGSGGHAITGVGFSPNFLWIKRRNASEGHRLVDSVRGATKFMSSNNDDVEYTDAGQVASLNSDGFTLGNGVGTNANSSPYVGWSWKAETSFTNDASSTGIGSIDSSGSVNETAGFSIVSFTGSGSAATIKHGLSTTPNMMIIKNRVTSTKDWQVYSPVNDPTDALALNQTDPTGDSDVYWNDTAPTSSVFSVKDGATNTSGAATIGYIFSERKGYSKFGSYTGNGNANGTFLYTGFLPAWIMIKATDQTGEGWFMFDNKRDVDNAVDKHLIGNANGAEASGSHAMDFVSNGIKIRNGGDGTNTSAKNYIYMAFAENPFVTSTGVPATAR